jgi:predicted MPP superfamily phosphohydrolase
VFTGDQVDARNTDLDVVRAFVKQAVQIAPCYLVNGNHEGNVPGMSDFNIELQEAGVTVLEDEMTTLQCNNDTLSLLGLKDPTIKYRFIELDKVSVLPEVIEGLSTATQGYSILLAHRPEYMELYATLGVDLVLSGHAHGGQIRIKDQGLFDPHQGFFPKYDAGQYTMDNTTMIISRGLGNSVFPWRINNPPELVVVELSAEQ